MASRRVAVANEYANCEARTLRNRGEIAADRAEAMDRDGIREMITKWKFRLSCAQAKPQALRRPNEKLSVVRRARETRPTPAETFSKQDLSSFQLGKLGSEPLRTF